MTDRIIRRTILALLILVFPAASYSQLRINEVSADNISFLSDEDGDYNDWIELFNNSSSAINLKGYHLSDDYRNLKKWTFPSVTVKPYSHIIVFASGKNRTDPPVNYETIISRGAEWEYLVPTSEPNYLWKNTGFNSTGWKKGKSGFGYGDNDDSTLLSNITSVYIRKEFVITSLDNIAELILSIDYDDGFKAYINGVEVACKNLGAGVGIPYNTVTGSLSREALIYNGGLAENYFIYNPRALLKEGVNVVAIQGHNASATSDDFSLIPMLTIGRYLNDIYDSVPAYIKLRGKKFHTNFKIDSSGETVILSRPDSSIADSVRGVRITPNISYGRSVDGANTWFYFARPTPAGINIGKTFDKLVIDTVKFSVTGGYKPGVFQLELSSVQASDSIFYTLDGSEPSVSSLLYKSPITITGNSVVRAVSIKSDKLPGEAVTNTFFNRKHKLPVVSISTNPPNLWDYYTGIYVMGPNASTVNPYFGANFWQDWEKKAHIELYDTNGVKQIDQDAGIKIYGAWSRARPQKSLALYARKEYGKGSFDYKVFSDKPIDKFEALVLRNGGNDWGQAMMRDGLTSTLVSDMDIDRQSYQPAVLYLNGEYWGILDLREKINPDYISENHFVDPEKVNLLVSNATALDGTNAGYNQLKTFLNTYTLENDQVYQQVASQIDVNNYIQYQLSEIYVDNRDWPGNNIKYWNTSEPGSKWRWIIYDTDFGFGYKGTTAYSYNTLEWALTPDATTGANVPWATLLFRRMTSNAAFRKEFANQYADRINRNFSPDRVTYVIDSIKTVYSSEMDYHLARWNITKTKWETACTVVRDFAVKRPDNARNHLRSKFGLGVLTPIKIEINQPSAGDVKINSIIPYKYPFTGQYFKDLPVKLTAIPAPGYKFVRWESGSSILNSQTIDYNMSGPASFKAVFTTARQTDIKIVINEICYSSSPLKDTKDWLELYNAGPATVNLKNWIVSDAAPETGFVIPDDQIIAPGMYLVICRDKEAFRTINPGTKNITGDFGFGLSRDGDDINLYDPAGNLVDFVEYDIRKPWPEVSENSGESIELIDIFADNNLGKNWRKSIPAGTPGTINYAIAEPSVNQVQNTEMRISAYPSPFRDYTTLRIEAKKSGRYRIDVFDTWGKIIKTIFDQDMEPGEFYADWNGDSADGKKAPEGVYIIKSYGAGQQSMIRVIKLK